VGAEMWVPVSMFVSLAVVLSLFFYFRFRARREVQATMRQLIERGQELSPELLEHLGEPRPAPQRDFRRGMVGVALGLAFLAFGLLLGEADAERPLLAISAFPFLIGLAYLLMWRINEKRSQ